MEGQRDLEHEARAAEEAASGAGQRDRHRRAAVLHERAAVFYDLLGKTEQAADARERARRERMQADADLPGARERESGRDD